MIKGYQKNIYVVEDIKSDIFDRAIFIMKKNITRASESSIKREAERIITEKTSYVQRQDKRKK